MKTLNAYLIHAVPTPTDTFQQVISDRKGLNIQYETQLEKVLDITPTRQYDLLVIDKALPIEDKTKLLKLIDHLYPEVATLELNLDNEAEIRSKITEMEAKWIDVQSDRKVHYMDGGGL